MILKARTPQSGLTFGFGEITKEVDYDLLEFVEVIVSNVFEATDVSVLESFAPAIPSGVGRFLLPRNSYYDVSIRAKVTNTITSQVRYTNYVHYKVV